MSKCPFWSTKLQRVECYKECPMLDCEGEKKKEKDDCVFREYAEENNINFKDVFKDEYNFLNLSIYEDEKEEGVNY